MSLVGANLVFIISAAALAIAMPSRQLKDEMMNQDNAFEDDYYEAEMQPIIEDMQFSSSTPEASTTPEKTTNYWIQQGVKYAKEKDRTHSSPKIAGHAKNIIFFVGNGMSIATLSATRVYLGDAAHSLSFEKFPHTGLSRTYTLDKLVPDSAAAATALLCGVKTKNGIIGLNGTAKRGSCNATMASSSLSSIAEWALDSNKWVGFVTTARVTAATTASLYAHLSECAWENDVQIAQTCGPHSAAAAVVVKDIARQMMEGNTGRRLKVMMGGGLSQFVDRQHYSNGKRTDGRDLIRDFCSKKGNVFINSKENWTYVNPSENGRLLALFDDDHLPYHKEMLSESNASIPSLSEMTEKAIEILKPNENGYFLLIEAANIDRAHHENRARLALDETAELNKAVAKALQMTDDRETLIIVTANHGQTMSVAGYFSRFGDIFGLAEKMANDSLPYKVISYANGPSYYHYRNAIERLDPSKISNTLLPHEKSLEVFPATVPMHAATHGGEDVSVYAHGPWAHLFDGIYEQSTIPHLLAFAGCFERKKKQKIKTKATTTTTACSWS